MIIDVILDRKDVGIYSLETLLSYCDDPYFDYIKVAIESGDEKAVKKALCRYLDDQSYPEQIKRYIRSVDWLI